MATPSLAQLIDDFARDLTARGRGVQTAANYRHYLRRFLRGTNVQSPAQITPATVANFRAWLLHRDGLHLDAATANYHLTALRSFLKYLARHKLTTFEPSDVALQPVPHRTRSTVENQGLNRLLNFPLKLEGKTVLQLRDRAILELLGTSGLRVGEITRLERDHVIAARGELAVHGRRGTVRIIPLTQHARYWITQYLKRRSDRAPQLFVRHDPAGKKSLRAPQALTPRSIQRLVKKYARAAGLPRATQPRVLRHTAAKNLLTSGNDLETVRQQLGHKTIASTKAYALPKRR